MSVKSGKVFRETRSREPWAARVQNATLPFLPGELLAAKSSTEAASEPKAEPPALQRRHRRLAQVEVDHPVGPRWRQ